jgi:ADP-ribosyl-[dinitrogen reductase] hydrolase
MTTHVNSLWGVIIGDALGLPVQFSDRDEMVRHPVLSMKGFGTFNKPKGFWSDDGALTLATADALSQGESLPRIMESFAAWLFLGAYTQDGVAYDMGQTTLTAIKNYQRGMPVDRCGGRSLYDNGNGSLMRILPAILWLRSNYASGFMHQPEAREILHNISALTHAHPIALIACGLYASVADALLDGSTIPTAIETGIERALTVYRDDPCFRPHLHWAEPLSDIHKLKLKPTTKIRSGGYVVETLEAALWCLLRTSSYRDAVLTAVNLGHDTDTTAAVTGGLAAIAYGPETIPSEWIESIPRIDLVIGILQRFDQSLKKKLP